MGADCGEDMVVDWRMRFGMERSLNEFERNSVVAMDGVRHSKIDRSIAMSLERCGVGGT